MKSWRSSLRFLRIVVALLPLLNCFATVALAALPMSGPSNAQLQLSNFQWGDVQISNIQLQHQQIENASWVLVLEGLKFQQYDLGQLSLSCGQGGDDALWACLAGTWEWHIQTKGDTSDTDGVTPLTGSFRTSASGEEQLHLAMNGASLTVKKAVNDWQWALDVHVEDISSMLAWWPASLPIQAAVLNGGLQLQASGNSNRAELQMALEAMDFDSEDGRVASGGLSMVIHADLVQQDGHWQWQSSGSIGPGAILWENWFIDLSDREAQFELSVGAQPAQGAWFVEHLRWIDEPGIQLVGHGSWANQSLQALNIEQLSLDLAQFTPSYLSGWLATMALDDLALGGVLSGSAEFAGGLEHFDLTLDAVQLVDGRSRFALNELSGRIELAESLATIAMHQGVSASPGFAPSQSISEISWDRLMVWGLESGASSMQGILQADAFHLTEQSRFPLLDGALRLDELKVQHSGDGDWELVLDAELEPIDMGLLTQAFGWPAFGGKLAGRLPGGSYEDGVLSLDGALDFEIFSGRVRLQSLALERTFGTLPSLSADLSVEGLDLEPLTQAFSFGRITGQLNGEINRLRLLNWEPVAFDARIYSTSKGRISQRAVDNLSRVGGGGAALGGIVGALFEEFPYRSLGLSCRLENNICHMGGVESIQNENAYYIVKGRGLPKITIKGFQKQVDWPVLLSQLKQIVAGPGSPEVR